MTARAYGGIAAGVVAVAIALTLIARAPRGTAPTPAAALALPSVSLALDLEAGGVVPAATQVPKDHRVELTVVNGRASDASLALAGYEDRVRAQTIAPGETLRASFVADRPGEGFAWLVDGEPAGRLAVTGSHLVEGHR